MNKLGQEVLNATIVNNEVKVDNPHIGTTFEQAYKEDYGLEEYEEITKVANTFISNNTLKDVCKCEEKCSKCGKPKETEGDKEFKKIVDESQYLEPLNKSQVIPCQHDLLDKNHKEYGLPGKPIHMLVCNCPRCSFYSL